MSVEPGMTALRGSVGKCKEWRPLSVPRSWLFRSALRENRQIPWVVISLLLTLLLKKILTFCFTGALSFTFHWNSQVCGSFSEPREILLSPVTYLLTFWCSRRGAHLGLRLGPDACLVLKLPGVLFPPWEIQGWGFREHFLCLEVVTVMLLCAVSFSVSVHPIAGDPVKVAFGKD